VVIYSSFVEEDRHGVFYSDGIDVLKVFLMVGISILDLFSSDFIDGMCVVALAHAVILIRGSTFHPLVAIQSISGLYLLFFASIVSGENLSL
jgi:hypothetical protein